MRSVFSNLMLLGLWHGKLKPDFKKLLSALVFELEYLRDANLFIEVLGAIKFRVRPIVADMLATVCVFCVIEFNR